jgi:hypothetical protein
MGKHVEYGVVGIYASDGDKNLGVMNLIIIPTTQKKN